MLYRLNVDIIAATDMLTNDNVRTFDLVLTCYENVNL